MTSSPHVLPHDSHPPPIANACPPLMAPFSPPPLQANNSNTAGSQRNFAPSPFPPYQAPRNHPLFHTAQPGLQPAPLRDHNPGTLSSLLARSPAPPHVFAHATHTTRPWSPFRVASSGQGTAPGHTAMHKHPLVPRPSTAPHAHGRGSGARAFLPSSLESLHRDTAKSRSSAQGWEWAAGRGSMSCVPLQYQHLRHQQQQQWQPPQDQQQPLPGRDSCGGEHQGSAGAPHSSSLRLRKPQGMSAGPDEQALPGQHHSSGAIMSRASSGLAFPEGSSQLWQKDSGSMLPLEGGTVQASLCSHPMFVLFG